MTYLHLSLVVLTLLQLCGAEISDKQPESWYSANVINDGFQPKPISEIFSTEASFSSTNPIIVQPKSNEIPDEIALLSTLPPLTRLRSSTIPMGFTNKLPISSTPSSMPTTEAPAISQSPPPSSSTIAVQTQTEPQKTARPGTILPNVQPVPPEIQPVLPLVREPPMVQSSLPEMQPTPIVIQVSPVQPDLSVLQPAQPIPVQSDNAQPPSQSQSSQTQSQQIRFELVPQMQTVANQAASNQPEVQAQQVTQLPNPQPTTLSPQSNYFLIYQQAPQNLQNYPLPPQTPANTAQMPVVSVAASQPTTIQQPTMPTRIPTISVPSIPSSPPQTVSPFINTMPTTRTLPTTTTLSDVGVNCQNTARLLPEFVTTQIPRTVPPILAYPLRIRVIAPRGSITKVKINPPTTTKKPKTPRTRKPKPKARKNSYDVCTDSCKGRRDPICAAPLSPGLIDPKNLKGFPSICHMACHNSFRKDTFEKIVDGRCGKLRTRIRTVDSNTKLNKDELVKAEYTLDNTGVGPKTIVEFSGSIN